MNVIVVDTGPIVALFNGGDKWHERCKCWLSQVEYPLVTNIAVVTEATHLLSFNQQAASDCLSWLKQAVRVDGKTAEDWLRIQQVVQRYSDLPADFADASLVALCERLKSARIATLDRDFDVYRYQNKLPFQREPI